MKNKGFTLIEVMIVMVIVIILAFVAVGAIKDNEPRMKRIGARPAPVEVAPAQWPLVEECFNEYVYVRGNEMIIQKLGPDGLPIRC